MTGMVAFWTVFFPNCYKFCISFDKKMIYSLGNGIDSRQEKELFILLNIFEAWYLTTCPTPQTEWIQFSKNNSINNLSKITHITIFHHWYATMLNNNMMLISALHWLNNINFTTAVRKAVDLFPGDETTEICKLGHSVSWVRTWLLWSNLDIE